MRCALYVRCSTTEQHPDNQIRELSEFASRQGWEIVRGFVDYGFSGKDHDRPQFKDMMVAASKRQFDCLLFWDLSRLSRAGTFKTLEVLQTLTRYGVSWRSYQEPFIDSAGPFAEVIISLIACLAKQERLKIGERTRAGLARVRAQGTRLGRPTVNVDVDVVRERIVKGESIRAVARSLQCSHALLLKRLAV